MTRDLLITLTLSICLSIKNSQISADHNAKLIPIKVDAHDSSLASGPKRSLTRYRRFGTKVKREEHNSSSTTEAPKKNKTSGFSGGFPPVPSKYFHNDNIRSTISSRRTVSCNSSPFCLINLIYNDWYIDIPFLLFHFPLLCLFHTFSLNLNSSVSRGVVPFFGPFINFPSSDSCNTTTIIPVQ